MKNLNLLINKSSFILILSLFVCADLYGQSFDPTSIGADFYNDKQFEDGKIYKGSDGFEYKISISDYSRCQRIKIDKRWLRHGVCYSMSSGRVTSQTNYVKGKRHGDELSFNRKSQVTRKTPYVNGKKHGTELAYHSNNQVSSEQEWQNGKKHGSYRYYSYDGSLNRKVSYKNGKKEGLDIQYHEGKGSSTGHIMFETPYQDGKRHGEKKQYNASGKLVSVEVFAEDKRISSRNID